MLLTEWNTEDAIAYAREETEEKWRSVVADKNAILADKDAALADKDMEIAKLKAELEARQ